ncbi:hypothetical protein D0X99_03060 [Algoriphagus lacus]|uniref:Uncharacterized protein n=1 Tax=Algoriphagus lacus TaxID=2056311 RepID=A0A418PWW7_9BACT|nr:hypothetical protein D0X99_03060 [Algoriphagus lacus]
MQTKARNTLNGFFLLFRNKRFLDYPLQRYRKLDGLVLRIRFKKIISVKFSMERIKFHRRFAHPIITYPEIL